MRGSDRGRELEQMSFSDSLRRRLRLLFVPLILEGQFFVTFLFRHKKITTNQRQKTHSYTIEAIPATFYPYLRFYIK